MEVHHHPDVEKKNFKEYLLEGLMIFLAVTMGFFAESLREHIGDNNREKEFAKALYLELREDSVAAAQKLQLRVAKNKELDYLYNYFKDSSLTVLPRRFYQSFTIGVYLINRYAFEPKDGIMSQLRNSGSLRYFKSVQLQKLLGDLSVDINNMRYRNEEEYQFFASPLKPFLLKHFDFYWLNQLRNENTNPNINSAFKDYMSGKIKTTGTILNANSFDRGEATNMVGFYRQLIVSTNSLQLNNYIVDNKRILQELRQNYSLD
jgi:hypothetical protein